MRRALTVLFYLAVWAAIITAWYLLGEVLS